MIQIGNETRRRFREDGVVFLPQVFDQATLAWARELFEWSIEHPTGSACEFYPGEPGRFYQDLCHPEAALAYREFLENTCAADVIAALWGSDEVWFLYEQIFLKEGEAMRRTPWHQDSPYLALDGEDIAVMWINFTPVAQSQSLEFVRGSHHGTLYDGSAFAEDDDTTPIYAHGLPRLPDIEGNRAAFDIVSYAVEPGDVVVFHPAMLHGGGAISNHVSRRTLSLRFFGADAVYAARPTPAPAPLTAGLHDQLKPGDRFRHPAFPRLRPTPSGFESIPRVAGAHARSLTSQFSTGR